MNSIYKAITFLSISFLLCFISMKIKSDFIDNFTNGFIPLLTTLLAINIASASLIAGKLKEISIRTGMKFEKTTKELKRSLTIQLILISISLLVLLLKSSKTISAIVGFDCLKIISYFWCKINNSKI